MRYAELLSELRAFEALAMYYANAVLWKARELDEYLAEVLGTPLPTLIDPPTEPAQVAEVSAVAQVERAERPADPPECLTLDEHKRRIIANCLAKYHGNINQAARELGISRNMFYPCYKRVYGANGDHQ